MSERNGNSPSLRASLGIIGLSVAAIVALRCIDRPDYSGEGNHFEVAGVVLGVQKDGTIQIDEEGLRVLSAEGRAKYWFDNDRGQDTLSTRNNIEPSYFAATGILGWLGLSCHVEQPVGHAFDVEDTEIPVQSVQPGTIAIVEGSVRDTSYSRRSRKIPSCGHEERAVYNTATVTNDPSITGMFIAPTEPTQNVG